MTKITTFIFIIITSVNTYCQLKKENIITDSSKIEIIRNSAYLISEETYNNKDSVFRCVRFINDTTKIHRVGWERKNGNYFGEWSEYEIDGSWLYTIDYTNHSWIYNEVKYKYQSIKNLIKQKADSLLIKKFGKDFFDQNIVFKFYGHTAIGKWKYYDNKKSWREERYLGDWREPVKEKPNIFVLDYTIKLGTNEFYSDIIRVKLDSTGNLISSSNPLSFEKIEISTKNSMNITKEKAIELCQQNTFAREAIGDFETDLCLSKKKNEVEANFYYEVKQMYKEEKIGDCKPNCVQIKYYYVWLINPYISKITQKKNMKYTITYDRGCSVGRFDEINE